jgi:hypothetical protein
MNRAVVLLVLVLLAACAKPAPSPLASKSACPESLSDVDRLACWAAARPETAPDAQKPATLLRNPDGTAVIGPKPAQSFVWPQQPPPDVGPRSSP